jgi:hypothetical protein
VVADKLPLTLDRNGAGKVTIDKLPASTRPQELLLEARYADPNGEVQTLRSVSTLWPAAVVAGIRTEGWVSLSSGAKEKVKFQALALDVAGKPAPGTAMEVKAVARITTSSRKRLVGGFYSYDNKTETKDLGSVCSGKSRRRGLLLCEAPLTEAGEVELVVTARDAAGNSTQAPRRSGSRARASCGLVAKTTTAWTCCPRRRATSRARPPNSRCACRSALPPRWWRWSAKALWTRRWYSSTARTQR